MYTIHGVIRHAVLLWKEGVKLLDPCFTDEEELFFFPNGRTIADL